MMSKRPPSSTAVVASSHGRRHAHRPLRSRPLDVLYIGWFATHLAIMFAVDLVPLYPSPLQPKPLLALRAWYIDTYHDRFFVQPPPWFTAYAWMEALYHVPLSVWAVGALVRDDPLVPVHLLIWAVQTAVTTATCVVEYGAWEGITDEEWWGLFGLYVPYLVLAILLGLDMFLRLRARLTSEHLKRD